MEITEVRIKLVEKTAERLMAFCSITIDGAFVIRDLKLIGGPHGLFVQCRVGSYVPIAGNVVLRIR